MRGSTILTTMTALVLIGPLVLAEAPQNDAGLGVDAGNTSATATPLPGLGRYSGELRSKDNDWYTVARTGLPACITLDAGGTPEATYTLRIRSGTTERFVSAPLPTDGERRLALAGSQVAQAWGGVERVPNPANNDPTRPGAYGFALGEVRASDATEGTSAVNDAGSVLSGAFPIEGSCTPGRLQPMNGVGDVVDLWSFTGKAGQQIIYSLGATAPITLQLTNATGGAVGPAIAPDAVANVTLPTDGQYTMRAAAPSGSELISYVIGLTGPDPPPGNPCRPTCWTG